MGWKNSNAPVRAASSLRDVWASLIEKYQPADEDAAEEVAFRPILDWRAVWASLDRADRRFWHAEIRESRKAARDAAAREDAEVPAPRDAAGRKAGTPLLADARPAEAPAPSEAGADPAVAREVARTADVSEPVNVSQAVDVADTAAFTDVRAIAEAMDVVTAEGGTRVLVSDAGPAPVASPEPVPAPGAARPKEAAGGRKDVGRTNPDAGADPDPEVTETPGTAVEPAPVPSGPVTAGEDMAADAAVEIAVSSLEELKAALAAATGGETIVLADGDYGELKLGATIAFDEAVTIRGGTFSGLKILGASGLVFDGATFDYTAAPAAALFVSPFLISNGASNIRIVNSVFDGDLATGLNEIEDGHGTGKGLVVRDSSNITVSGNEFFNFMWAATFGQTTDITLADNDVHSIRQDGFTFAEVRNVLVEGNFIHDFDRAIGSTDHCDMLQIWTTGTETPSENVTIRGNMLLAGDGDATQSIFFRNQLVDQGKAGAEMFYRNFLIEQNVIHNGHMHGITVGETDGLTVRHNTLLHNAFSADDGSVSVPKINLAEASTNVAMTDNIAGGWNGQQDWQDPAPAAWDVSGNVFVQRTSPTGPGYYDDLFINAMEGTGLDDLRLKEAMEAGADMSQPIDDGMLGTTSFAEADGLF